MNPARTIRSGWCEFTTRLSSTSQSCLVDPGLRLRYVFNASTWVAMGGSHPLALSNPNTFDLLEITAFTFTEDGSCIDGFVGNGVDVFWCGRLSSIACRFVPIEFYWAALVAQSAIQPTTA